jgi:hypothetical protein
MSGKTGSHLSVPKISRMQIFDLLARKSEIYERLNMNSDWVDLDFVVWLSLLNENGHSSKR